MARKDYNIDSNVEVEGEELTGFVGEEQDLEDLEILGFATMTTIGGGRGMTVPREWLIPRMDELGIPEFMHPNEPRTSSAFKRALNYHMLIEREEKVVNGHRIKPDVEKGEGNTHHILANVYVPAEQIAENEGIDEEEAEGEWRQVTLGLAKYDDGHMMTIDKIDEESPLWDEWDYLRNRAYNLFDELQSAHVGYDFQVITYHLRKHWTNSVPLRDGGAVAFIPATPKVTEVLEGLSTLFAEVSEKFKEKGKKMEVNTIPVLNTASQQRMVEARAEEQVEQIAGDLVDETREQLQEDIPIEEVARNIASELEEAEDFEAQYNSLLDAELSARRLIEEWVDEFDSDLRGVLAEAGFDVGDAEAGVQIVEKGGGWFGIEVSGNEVESVQGRDAAEQFVADNF